MYSNHSNHDNQIEESRSPPDSQRRPPSSHPSSPQVRSSASPEARASPGARGSPASRSDPHQILLSQMTFGAKKVPDDAIAPEYRAQISEHPHDQAQALQAEEPSQVGGLELEEHAAGGDSATAPAETHPQEDISRHQILVQNRRLQRESGSDLPLNDELPRGELCAGASREAAAKDTHAEAKQGSQAPLASQLTEQKSEKYDEHSMEIDVTAQQNELISREFGNGNEPVKSHINSVEKQEGSACVREEQQPVAIASQCKEDVENQNNVTDSCDNIKPNLPEDQNAHSCLSSRQGDLVAYSELERPDQYTPGNRRENEGNQVFQNGEITSKKQISDQPIEKFSNANTNSPHKDHSNMQFSSPQPKQTPKYSQMKTRFNGSKNVQVQDDQASMRQRKNTKVDSGQNSNSKQKAPSHEKNSSFKNHLKGLAPQAAFDSDKTHCNMVSIYNQGARNDQMQKVKKQASNQFEECLKTYGKMFQFDWDLKEFMNTRHSPKEDLTPGAFWFYVNTTFFRYDLLELLQEKSFNEWTRPIIEAQNRYSLFGSLNSCSQFHLQQSPLPEQQQQQETIVRYLPNGKVRIHSPNIIQSQYAREDGNLLDDNDECMSDDDDQWNFIDCKSTQDIFDICKNDEKNEQLLFHVAKLIAKRKKFLRFKKHFCHLDHRARHHEFDDQQMIDMKTKAKEIPRYPIVAPFLSHRDHEESYDQKGQSYVINNELTHVNDQDPDKEIAEIKKTMHLQNFQRMMHIAEKDLEELHANNQAQLHELYERVSTKFSQALEISPGSPRFRDRAVYKPQNIREYGQDFLSYVDPHYVQDIMHNREWYNQNMDRFLLNLNYPCKLQNDFLKELELAQQRRNDMKYRKILDQMDRMESMRNDQGMDSQTKRMKLEQEIKQMNQKQRALIAQDGACCAICGVGDYEDDDQIVFCVRCSIPVHQSCFGLENIPDIDWICYNCFTFGFQRGLMVKCFLCPKRGGAMKPTNIFRSYDKYYDQKIKILTKKTGKSQIEKLQNLAQQQSQMQSISEEQLEAQQSQGKDDVQPYNIYKQQVTQRLENNCCLAEVLQREFNYHEKIYMELYEEENKDNASSAVKKEPLDEKRASKLHAYQKIMKEQEEFELNFNDHERNNHCIPEDYSHFIQRNETKLELPETPITDSLYHWVHHSCSMWTQGPQITPKTPVKMNRLDFQKFSIGCIICGKKGVNVGAAVKCFKQDCQIYFHVECAKRANYCMEVDKKGGKNNRDKTFKIYCESHRPFKIIQEINDLNQKEIEEIQKFAKTIEKCYDSYIRYQQKPKKLISKTERNKLLRQALQTRKQELVQQKKEMKLLNKPKKEKKGKKEKQKKWKEKDKKILLERVKDKYLAIKKLRFNLIKVNPMIAETKRYEKELKRIQKLKEKKRKKQLEIQKDIYLKKLLGERDVKNQSRGLRQRNKLNENEDDMGHREQSMADGLNTTTDPNMQEQPSMNEEALRNYQETANGDQMDANHDVQMQIDQSSDKGGDQELKLSLENEDELFQLPTLQEIPEYYKYANPMNIQELEWTVTLSRFDFPWHEIEFEPFSAKECYKMYTSLVTDAQSFLKRVLGDKVKYQKMIQNQLKGLPTIDLLINMQNPMANNPIVLAPLFESSEKQSKDPKNDLALVKKDSHMTLGDQQADAKDQMNVAAGNLVNLGYFTFYCVCKGQVQQEFMVACENGEDLCPNKGWLHPQCTDDLKDLSKDEIDQMEIWYCMDCRKKTNTHLSNSKEKKTKPMEQSPHKSSQKRGGSICDSIEKKENLSNDSLKKQLIIRFTAEDLDEQPRNRPNDERQDSHSERSSSGKQSMELQANEKFVDPRNANPQQKFQQQQFQVNQMKQVKLEGFRADDGGSKPQSKSKQSAFSKSGEGVAKRANQSYLNQRLNLIKPSNTAPSKPTTNKRKMNQTSNIFQIHSDYDNAPSLAKKQRHDQPVPGMKKNAQLFQNSKTKPHIHQKGGEGNNDREGQVDAQNANGHADAAFLEHFQQDILDILKSEQQNNEQQKNQQQSAYHSQSYQNGKSNNQGAKHNADQLDQYSQSNRQRGNSNQQSNQDDQLLIQQIHQLLQMPASSNGPDQHQNGGNNLQQQQQQQDNQQDFDKLIQDILLQYQDQSNDDQTANQQLLKLILENQPDQNETKPSEMDRKKHQPQHSNQKMMVQNQEQKERNYEMVEYQHQQSKNQQQQQHELMELFQMQNQGAQHQEKQKKQQQQQQSEQGHMNQMNVEEQSQNDILKLISLLAAESPQQTSKNQQQYDPSELPEELKHIQEKAMGLENIIENFQKQKISKQQQRQIYQKQQQQQQYEDHQRSKSYHNQHQSHQQQQQQHQQQHQQTHQMEQLLSNILMVHMEQQQQHQQQQQNTSIYQGSNSKPQNSQQSHQQHSGMHMQESAKMHVNSSSATREMATPEQQYFMKMLANQSQMEAKQQSTPQQKNQQQDEDVEDCMVAKSNNHNYQQLVRQNYQGGHQNQQQMQYSPHEYASYEQQMNNYGTYFKKQVGGGQAHQQSQGYQNDKKSLQQQHLQQYNYVLNGAATNAAQATSAAHHQRKISHSSSGYVNSGQQYGPQASQHHISQQQASNQYESQMHHQQQMQAHQQQQQLQSQILQQVPKDELEMYELSDDQLQMLLSQISQNKL